MFHTQSVVPTGMNLGITSLPCVHPMFNKVKFQVGSEAVALVGVTAFAEAVGSPSVLSPMVMVFKTSRSMVSTEIRSPG